MTLKYVIQWCIREQTIDSVQSRIALSLKLVSYIGYIQNVLGKDVFDYSAVHVISQWMSECFTGPHEEFSSVVVHVQALSDIVALTTGIGLPEIWSGLSHRVVGFKDLNKIQQLDLTLQQLPYSLKGKTCLIIGQTIFMRTIGLRQEGFELVALMTLPVSLHAHDRKNLDDLALRLQKVGLLHYHMDPPN